MDCTRVFSFAITVVAAIVFIYLLGIIKGKIPSFTDESGNVIPRSIS